jgi:hypothetical protein
MCVHLYIKSAFCVVVSLVLLLDAACMYTLTRISLKDEFFLGAHAHASAVTAQYTQYSVGRGPWSWSEVGVGMDSLTLSSPPINDHLKAKKEIFARNAEVDPLAFAI